MPSEPGGRKAPDRAEGAADRAEGAPDRTPAGRESTEDGPPARRRFKPRSLARGLRARLVVAFLLVAALSALTTAALTFREARNAILKRSQDTAVQSLRSQVNAQVPDVAFPPDKNALWSFTNDLERRGQSLRWSIRARYKDGPTIPEGGAAAPRKLQEKVHNNVTAFQRIETRGEPYLVIGLPVTFADNGSSPSGLEVYAWVPLRGEEANVQALVQAAQRGALPAFAIAIVPALFAARGVLRPVRELRRATQKITEGELDTRLKVTGGDELADLSRTFNGMAEALEKNVAELRRMEANARRFAADVSHELRTPLAAMTAVADVLDEDVGDLDPDTGHAVRLITEETGKLAHMVEDLMEVSRFDAGAAALHLDEVDIREAVRKTLQARAWEGRVTADLPEGVRARIDPRRIDVVVANLVGNALRHGGPPVRITARTEHREDGDRLLIEISDGGSGIDPEVLPHVFDRFYKADAARARSEGSGLGLAITMENVRLHDGTVRAANGPEGGAVFTVELPLRRGGASA